MEKKQGWMKKAWDDEYKGESLEYQRELTAPTMESLGPPDPVESTDGPASFDRWQETSGWEENSSPSRVEVWFGAPELSSDEEIMRMKASVLPDEYEEIADIMSYLVSQKMYDVSLGKTQSGFVIHLDYDEMGNDYRAKEFSTLNEALETLAHITNY